jgi:hypothetical protein
LSVKLLRPRLSLPPNKVVPPRLVDLKLRLLVPTGKSPTLVAVVPLLLPQLPSVPALLVTLV